MARLFYIHETDDGREYVDTIHSADLPEPRTVSVLAPVTTITVQHNFPRRFTRVALMDLQYYEVPRTVVARLFYGDNGDDTYFVTIDFNTPFSGVIRIDP